jgi:membrane protease YdiL (CAAX protease family)
VIAALLALVPYLAAGFFAARFGKWVRGLAVPMRLLVPACLCVPYVLVVVDRGGFSTHWLALYALMPVAMAVLMIISGALGKGGGYWIELLVLAVLGLAVDLRWFEGAWPAHFAIFNKVLLLDAGIYAIVGVRNLEGVGFDLRMRFKDVVIGLREFLFFFPFALALGLGLHFLHLHAFGSVMPVLLKFAGAWLFTFFFIAVPEELFFRGWMQNLLERRMGRTAALLVTAILFGLSHFNKRAAFFNWRYVLLAAIAGVFYGRAWRRDRRVGASSVTHATVDSVWSMWLR